MVVREIKASSIASEVLFGGMQNNSVHIGDTRGHFWSFSNLVQYFEKCLKP